MGAAREADLARYDERGVVIAAPLQGSEATLAGPRYGDKHRGPAVADSYELWHCRIDLAERSERWPCPANLPPRMVELAQTVPEDQREDFIRRQANYEEIDRRISYAIRAGDLPIWVAPKGEPERLVAVGALATIDKRSINGGVFCPVSEEYKSEADRPWLWERPLFVKWVDWVSFAMALDNKMRPTVAPHALVPSLPPEGQFVTLSHALSWAAFGDSMDSDQLHEVLTLDRYGEHHPQEAIKAALAELVELGRAGRVAMEGKYRESHRVDKRTLLTIAIEPTKFANFRQFNYLNDELKHGDGLWQWRQSKTVELRGNRRGGRLDSFIEVGVNRTDLLREFHSESSENSLPIQKASETPTELPVWLNPYQLKAWVLYRNLALVARAGDWNGLAAQRLYGDEEPIIGSIKELIDCLQVGRMIAQGQKNGETFQPIAPVEWTRIALAPLDLSRQHPYVRIQFNRRDVLAIFPTIGGEAVEVSSAETEAAALRAPAVKAGRPPSPEEILAKADEMKARGMDGRTIAKEMRLEPGFCNVATTAVRDLIKGRWKPSGRPKKSA